MNRTYQLYRTFLMIAFLLSAVMAMAQSESYTAVVEKVELDSSPKALFTAVADLVSDAEMTHDAISGILEIRTNILITGQELEAVVVPAGYYLLSFQQN